jgi:hypothetical protein
VTELFPIDRAAANITLNGVLMLMLVGRRKKPILVHSWIAELLLSKHVPDQSQAVGRISYQALVSSRTVQLMYQGLRFPFRLNPVFGVEGNWIEVVEGQYISFIV